MLDYAQIHIFDACGHYKGRLLLILILHNVMHDITSTLPVDVAPSARFTQNGRPMSIAGGRQEWFGYYWLWFNCGDGRVAFIVRRVAESVGGPTIVGAKPKTLMRFG